MGYVPALGQALQSLLNATDRIEYEVAVQEATTAIFYPGSYFPDLPKFQPLLLQKVEGIDEDLLLDSAIVDCGNQKNITITKIQGRDNTVKEFIADGDYTINVKGILAYKGTNWPKEELLKLKKFLDAKQSIPIVHEKLNTLGSYEIVITGRDFPETTFINCIPYSFTALSEEPTELTITG